jgi:hypothetical protein
LQREAEARDLAAIDRVAAVVPRTIAHVLDQAAGTAPARGRAMWISARELGLTRKGVGSILVQTDDLRSE